MLKRYKDIDELFRANLENHQVTPSPLAWEKLERKTRKKNESLWVVWGTWAASLALLMGLTYSIWRGGTAESGIEREIATMDSSLKNQKDNIQEEIGSGENLEEAGKETTALPQALVEKEKFPGHTTTPPNFKQIPARKLPEERILETEKFPEIERSWTEPIEASSMKIPPIELESFLAVNSLEQKEGNSMEYTVRIVSRGYALAPEKENLVDEIENKIEKIGSFISKVDQGFSELQDAKNNLFASLTNKKEKTKTQ